MAGLRNQIHGDCGYDSDKISKLFPKYSPKIDHKLVTPITPTGSSSELDFEQVEEQGKLNITFDEMLEDRIFNASRNDMNHSHSSEGAREASESLARSDSRVIINSILDEETDRDGDLSANDDSGLEISSRRIPYYQVSKSLEPYRASSTPQKDHHQSCRKHNCGDARVKDARIEAAGGREVFNQSKAKVYRRRLSEDERLKAPARVWELRPKFSHEKGRSMKKAPPEYTETVFSSQVKSIRRRRPISLANVGGSIVYDDIGAESDSTDSDIAYSYRSVKHRHARKSKEPVSITANKSSLNHSAESFFELDKRNDESLSINIASLSPELSSNLSIAEYTESPRKLGRTIRNGTSYGNSHGNGHDNGNDWSSCASVISEPTLVTTAPTSTTTSTISLPRPGFPLRVLEPSREYTTPANTKICHDNDGASRASQSHTAPSHAESSDTASSLTELTDTVLSLTAESRTGIPHTGFSPIPSPLTTESHARLSHTVSSPTTESRAMLSHTGFSPVPLSFTGFSPAPLSHAVKSPTSLSHTVSSPTTESRARLSHTGFSPTPLSHTVSSPTVESCTMLSHTGFSPVSLSHAVESPTAETRARLPRAVDSPARFSHVVLSPSAESHAAVSHAAFSQTAASHKAESHAGISRTAELPARSSQTGFSSTFLPTALSHAAESPAVSQTVLSHAAISHKEHSHTAPSHNHMHTHACWTDGNDTMVDGPPASTYKSKSAANFDYLYEYSETRKVLEEFFKPPNLEVRDAPENFMEYDYSLKKVEMLLPERTNPHIGSRLANNAESPILPEQQPPPQNCNASREEQPKRSTDEYLNFRCNEHAFHRGKCKNHSATLSPAWPMKEHCSDHRSIFCPSTSDLDSGDEMGVETGDVSSLLLMMDPDLAVVSKKRFSQMPVLEDGLSSGRSDVEDDNFRVETLKTEISEIENETDDPIYAKINENDDFLSKSNDHRTNNQNNNYKVGNSIPCDSDSDLKFLDPLVLSDESLKSPESPRRQMSCPFPRAGTPMVPCPGTGKRILPEGREKNRNGPLLRKANTDPFSDGSGNHAPLLPQKPNKADPWTTRNSGDKMKNSSHVEDDLGDAETDLETDRLLGGQSKSDDKGFFDEKMDKDGMMKKRKNKEEFKTDPSVLLEGLLFRARYLGSTQLTCDGQPNKATRTMQAEEAVARIKAPDGEAQPNTEVDLFISTEKIMVLNTGAKEIMMDHALRTISYIADIGNLVVLMARRRYAVVDLDDPMKMSRPPKMICHIFRSDEAQMIAQSIGQSFQVAYMEFLKANGIEDQSFVKEMDYQEVLNSQEIFGDELKMFARKELHKEIVVPKMKGEILGVVIVESGWGSMLPAVVIANLAPTGAAARCGQLNIGDQIIAINGISLVGLPLSSCQHYIKNSKQHTAIKLTVVPCAPVVEVKIKRPDTKYQLGFSVQNGVICSLLRGGIAERGGVRVGHRIIEINNQSVVAVPHEKIVTLLATSVGEIHMKTMPTSMFRLLTGQENPVFI